MLTMHSLALVAGCSESYPTTRYAASNDIDIEVTVARLARKEIQGTLFTFVYFDYHVSNRRSESVHFNPGRIGIS